MKLCKRNWTVSSLAISLTLLYLDRNKSKLDHDLLYHYYVMVRKRSKQVPWSQDVEFFESFKNNISVFGPYFEIRCPYKKKRKEETKRLELWNGG